MNKSNFKLLIIAIILIIPIAILHGKMQEEIKGLHQEKNFWQNAYAELKQVNKDLVIANDKLQSSLDDWMDGSYCINSIEDVSHGN